LLCQTDSGCTINAKPQAAVRWVRTVDGWERPDSWNSHAPTLPALHPLVVAAGQGLFSLLGLTLFHRNDA
jgi:hypothetical protein